MMKALKDYAEKIKDQKPSFIDPSFISANQREFVNNYEFNLLHFISHESNETFINGLDYIEGEVEFIKLCLEKLLIRRDIIRNKKEEILQEFLKLNGLTFANVPWARRDYNENLDYDEFFIHQKEYLEFEKNHYKIEESETFEYYSFKTKVHYLLLKAGKLGFTISIDEGIVLKEIESNQTLKSAKPKNSGLSATEKLICLEELGIIDHINASNEDLSINKLSKLLSLITGENHLQPALNAMKWEKYSSPKSPYYSSKNAPGVQDLLLKWGFDIKSE